MSYLDPEFVATLGPAAMGDPSGIRRGWTKSGATPSPNRKTSAASDYYAASLMRNP